MFGYGNLYWFGDSPRVRGIYEWFPEWNEGSRVRVRYDTDMDGKNWATLKNATMFRVQGMLTTTDGDAIGTYDLEPLQGVSFEIDNEALVCPHDQTFT